MSRLYVQSEGTAARRRFPVYLVDATDGITPETGESGGQPQISKVGGAWANTTATLTAIGNGAYYVELTATELDTLGSIQIRYKSASTAEFNMDGEVVAINIHDTVRLGLTALPNVASGNAGAIITSGTGTAQLSVSGGRANADLTHIATVAVSTSTAQLGVNVVNFGGSAGTFASGRPEVNTTHWGGTAVASAVVSCNAIQISGDATAADNAESFFDGTGYAGTNNVIPTVTTLTNAPSDSSGVTTLLSRLTATRAGYLDNLSAGAVATASKLLKFIQLLLRKDAAIATDNATEVTEINANGGSGAGAFVNTTDSNEAIRDRGDAAWITATGFSTLDASGVRSAVGLAIANLDTQLATLATASALSTVSTNVSTAVTQTTASAIRADVGLASANLDTQLAAIAGYIDTEVASIVSNVATILSAVDTEIAAIKAKTDNLPASPAAVSDIPTANANADALLDRAGAIDGKTPREAWRIIGATAAGKLSGSQTNTEVFVGLDGVTTRVTATVDASGNRSAITYG